MSADLNKLKHILAKSKAVMKQTDAELGAPMGNNTQTAISNSPTPVVEYGEKEMPNLTEAFAEKYGMSDGKLSKTVAPKGGNYPNLEKSKMPKAVLDAMINNPIEIPENPFAGSSFSLEDVPELVEPPRQQVSETIQRPQSNGSVSRKEIKEVIREEFEDNIWKSLW
jgi:hypothetical protein